MEYVHITDEDVTREKRDVRMRCDSLCNPPDACGCICKKDDEGFSITHLGKHSCETVYRASSFYNIYLEYYNVEDLDIIKLKALDSLVGDPTGDPKISSRKKLRDERSEERRFTEKN